MYCPKCSLQQAADQVRFCSRCGFQLNVVKELLASDSEPTTNEGETLDSRARPRQRDVNLGSTLMLIGAALAALSTTIVGGPPTVMIGAALLVFTTVLFFILLFSQPLMRALYKISGGQAQTNDVSPRRSDANVGAMIMFIATLISIFIAMFLGADFRTPILLASVISFVFTLLLSNRLAQTFHNLFSEGAVDANLVSQVIPTTRNPPALASAQSIPIDNTNSRRVNTAEMVQPPSITEHTTTLLDKT